MWASICRIALRTVPRCGAVALLLLSLGVYALFPACKGYLEIRADKAARYELTAFADGRADLAGIAQLEGVEKVTPVLRQSVSLRAKDYTLSAPVMAVHSSFPQLDFTEGAMYPESANMPYLILNEAAASSFLKDYKTVRIGAGETVRMDMGGYSGKAQIAGVFRDGTDRPLVYMSYQTALQVCGPVGDTELIIVLENKGRAETTLAALQKLGIYGSFDPTVALAWELRGAQCRQTALLSLALLVSAATLLSRRRREELARRRGERAMLMLSGMTASGVNAVYPARLALGQLGCLLAAGALAVAADTFSTLGVLAGACIPAAVLRLSLINIAGDGGIREW